MRERDNNKILNKNDIILFAVVLILAFFVIFFLGQSRTEGYHVRIMLEGNELAILALDEEQEYIVENKYGRNTVVIKNNLVYVTEADCPDGICMDYKPVNEVGETIICLPHKLVIEIVE